MSRLIVTAALVLMAGPSLAAVTPPCGLWERSRFELLPGNFDCQYRFDAAGSLDELTVLVTLRDCFDTPVEGCNVRATLSAGPGTAALCGCESLEQVQTSGPGGLVEFHFSRIGGWGTADVTLTYLCAGEIDLGTLEVPFTTPDLNGSCEPGASTNIVDLGIFANGLSAYFPAADFDCSGDINIVDLGIWASGLDAGCD